MLAKTRKVAADLRPRAFEQNRCFGGPTGGSRAPTATAGALRCSTYMDEGGRDRTTGGRVGTGSGRAVPSLLGKYPESYSSRLGSLIRLHFGGNNGKEKISGILRVVLDRLSPGRSAADREAAEASTMEMGDFDAPNKFEVTGKVINEANVTRRELRAHDKEQERRDAFKQRPVPSSAP